MVAVVAFKFSVMRCQPLRRALYAIRVGCPP
ncbi:acetyltransferase [Vibrio cholerae]|uniref:Acetyltransferase n=1 Tax=Vibrio cholerae TaxID=666 RepID=A0A5Q6PD20_VIBCL|nr:acetyltransferase [Vibrio cholerae]EGR4173814.1 acetyltransferase [Vibrio cholerae]KAA1205781.1 acetyltransferase [Vibrio cholerae]KAA1252529.1 acetyltransferase [Vibrio cholerae]